ELAARWSELKDQERAQGAALRQLDTRVAELDARAAAIAAEEKRLEEARGDIDPRLDAAKTLQRDLEQREQRLVALEARHAEQEKRLGRRAAKTAATETQLANKVRDVREAEERIPVLEERAFELDARARDLERVSNELGERGAWLTEAVTRVEAREAEAAEQLERAAAEVRRVERREQEVDEWSARLEERGPPAAQLDDRDRRLTEAYEALTERRRRLREDEIGLQPTEPA